MNPVKAAQVIEMTVRREPTPKMIAAAKFIMVNHNDDANIRAQWIAMFDAALELKD